MWNVRLSLTLLSVLGSGPQTTAFSPLSFPFLTTSLPPNHLLSSLLSSHLIPCSPFPSPSLLSSPFLLPVFPSLLSSSFLASLHPLCPLPSHLLSLFLPPLSSTLPSPHPLLLFASLPLLPSIILLSYSSAPSHSLPWLGCSIQNPLFLCELYKRGHSGVLLFREPFPFLLGKVLLHPSDLHSVCSLDPEPHGGWALWTLVCMDTLHPHRRQRPGLLPLPYQGL